MNTNLQNFGGSLRKTSRATSLTEQSFLTQPANESSVVTPPVTTTTMSAANAGVIKDNPTIIGKLIQLKQEIDNKKNTELQSDLISAITKQASLENKEYKPIYNAFGSVDTLIGGNVYKRTYRHPEDVANSNNNRDIDYYIRIENTTGVDGNATQTKTLLRVHQHQKDNAPNDTHVVILSKPEKNVPDNNPSHHGAIKEFGNNKNGAKKTYEANAQAHFERKLTHQEQSIIYTDISKSKANEVTHPYLFSKTSNGPAL